MELSELKSKTRRNIQKTKWYHGTTISGYQGIMDKGVKFDFSWGSELDFGPGFYLAPEKRMAEDFVKQQLSFKTSEGIEEFLSPDSLVPVVLEFEFSTMPYLERGELKILDVNDREFASFVTDNRIRAIEGLLHNYPLIYGIMSDNNPADLVSKFRDGELDKEEVIQGIMDRTISKRQLSIHTQDICDILKLTKAYVVDGGKELDINGYRNSN
ncbi:DUF3990 domain-containing protein [Planomicrobium okeanokoites]|uniref:DUF3990 domain-containing protein n=1 Tax=Planomicrobium okeanokoites TaxID=244 RepID=UPI000A03A9E9|nr:DUF3990 domain-containing protein [Planomicrobium okeanokoites]